MATLEQEMNQRAAGAQAAAEQFFAKPLFQSKRFIVATALGLAALILDIRLDILVYNANRMSSETLAWYAGGIIVMAWFAAASELESLRAFYLNETADNPRASAALSVALMSSVGAILGGLTVVYLVALLFLGIIWRLPIPAIHSH
jgi:hypothetical protein